MIINYTKIPSRYKNKKSKKEKRIYYTIDLAKEL